MHQVHLRLNFPVSLIHRPQLAVSNVRVGRYEGHARDFKKYFRPMRLIGTALAAFAAMFFGWLNVRRDRKVILSFVLFVSGICFWVYAIAGWINWRLGM